jgi:hypothetical protein
MLLEKATELGVLGPEVADPFAVHLRTMLGH